MPLCVCVGGIELTLYWHELSKHFHSWQCQHALSVLLTALRYFTCIWAHSQT